MYERVQAVAKVQQYHECFQMDILSVLHVDLGINSLEGIAQCTRYEIYTVLLSQAESRQSLLDEGDLY